MGTTQRREKGRQTDEDRQPGPVVPAKQGVYARTYLLSVLKDAAGTPPKR
ncbi:MAG: hypothetical protein R3B97_06065 [Dehalococcoidia bacterium]|nr:hypothetical protein [Dehalococcoidia bacterium]MCB9486343.1 hypothetical protein [Thermoflexaceae bacterium]